MDPIVMVPTDLLSLNQRKEQFSIAYVHAMSAAAGYSLSIKFVDDDSVDLTVCSNSRFFKWKSPKLDIQLKCTSLECVDEEKLTFPLKQKNYNELAMDSLVPRILVVLHVPNSLESWGQQTEINMSLQNCAYWLNLNGTESNENSYSTTVHIPRTNVFNANALHIMMQKIGQGASL